MLRSALVETSPLYFSYGCNIPPFLLRRIPLGRAYRLQTVKDVFGAGTHRPLAKKDSHNEQPDFSDLRRIGGPNRQEGHNRTEPEVTVSGEIPFR